MIRAARSQPAPRSLSTGKRWAGKDVCEALYLDFGGKCYLCERVLARGAIEVDHRRPRAAFPERCFDWHNLFPSCHWCNGSRPERYPDGSQRQYPTAANLLDPTVDDVESLLSQKYDVIESRIRFDAREVGDLHATYTAHELEHLHNAPTPRAADLRNAIHRYLVVVLDEARRYERLRREPAGVELADATSRLRRLLSRAAPFTALVRSVVPDLADLFD